jgi:hypothetical protein
MSNIYRNIYGICFEIHRSVQALFQTLQTRLDLYNSEISFSIESSLTLKLMCLIRNMNFHCDLWTGSCGRPAQWNPPSPIPI